MVADTEEEEPLRGAEEEGEIGLHPPIINTLQRAKNLTISATRHERLLRKLLIRIRIDWCRTQTLKI